MLYRFKSKASGDVVMLANNGRHLLEIIGKDPSGPGILLPEQMPGAVQALHDAIEHEERQAERMRREASERGDEPPEFDSVTLRVRVAPFIELLSHSMREQAEVVWGV